MRGLPCLRHGRTLPETSQSFHGLHDRADSLLTNTALVIDPIFSPPSLFTYFMDSFSLCFLLARYSCRFVEISRVFSDPWAFVWFGFFSPLILDYLSRFFLHFRTFFFLKKKKRKKNVGTGHSQVSAGNPRSNGWYSYMLGRSMSPIVTRGAASNAVACSIWAPHSSRKIGIHNIIMWFSFLWVNNCLVLEKLLFTI